ncbi:hypothetical protein QYE76_013040 [Lolium multiflorum]|uniref:Uncharacterized protein n=1 Tax=Lolium multiflorum TaxID=4521 RepID=A0AAD8U272_LOLMU|nr:hypothetical protein QYE76_013040 [Lolium multiflorum]
MSSPARSTVSAASAGGGTAIPAADDVADSIDAFYRMDEAMTELRSDVMEALQKEVRSLDDNNWMFAAPRSRINLVSKPGGYLRKPQGKIAELDQAPKKTRNC